MSQTSCHTILLETIQDKSTFEFVFTDWNLSHRNNLPDTYSPHNHNDGLIRGTRHHKKQRNLRKKSQRIIAQGLREVAEDNIYTAQKSNEKEREVWEAGFQLVANLTSHKVGWECE